MWCGQKAEKNDLFSLSVQLNSSLAERAHVLDRQGVLTVQLGQRGLEPWVKNTARNIVHTRLASSVWASRFDRQTLETQFFCFC